MTAHLVFTSFVTKVILHDNATKKEIIATAKENHRINIESDFEKCIEFIQLDTEIPSNRLTDNSSTMLEQLKKHIHETSLKELKKEWEEIRAMELKGLNVSDFIELLNKKYKL